MSVRAPVGPVNFATETVCIGRGLAAIRSGKELDRSFLFHQLPSLQPEIAGKEGAVICLDQQVRDCGAVDSYPLTSRTASNCRSARRSVCRPRQRPSQRRKKNLQNARALFESHLQSIFTQRGKGWVEKRLDQIGKTQTGSTPRTADKFNYGGFIPFVKPADFNADGSLDYDNDGLSETGSAGARKVAAGSTLMACIGATIGKCGYSEREVTTNQQINALTPTDGSSHRFICYQMRTESFQRSVIHNSGQATLPIINKSKWSDLPLRLPPKPEEQERIAAKLDALLEETQRLASLYQQKLAALAELKKVAAPPSLLRRALSRRVPFRRDDLRVVRRLAGERPHPPGGRHGGRPSGG